MLIRLKPAKDYLVHRVSLGQRISDAQDIFPALIRAFRIKTPHGPAHRNFFHELQHVQVVKGGTAYFPVRERVTRIDHLNTQFLQNFSKTRQEISDAELYPTRLGQRDYDHAPASRSVAQDRRGDLHVPAQRVRHRHRHGVALATSRAVRVAIQHDAPICEARGLLVPNEPRVLRDEASGAKRVVPIKDDQRLLGRVPAANVRRHRAGRLRVRGPNIRNAFGVNIGGGWRGSWLRCWGGGVNHTRGGVG
mmetsp:Transcript_72900/g.202272  ORF Transcript_72900/g.202272 Transcript_72900/m.202272 type:complete len:249 (-) Transcript_72900:1296-2042(-)